MRKVKIACSNKLKVIMTIKHSMCYIVSGKRFFNSDLFSKTLSTWLLWPALEEELVCLQTFFSFLLEIEPESIQDWQASFTLSSEEAEWKTKVLRNSKPFKKQ